jgi:hypothetical protein
MMPAKHSVPLGGSASLSLTSILAIQIHLCVPWGDREGEGDEHWFLRIVTSKREKSVKKVKKVCKRDIKCCWGYRVPRTYSLSVTDPDVCWTDQRRRVCQRDTRDALVHSLRFYTLEILNLYFTHS